MSTFTPNLNLELQAIGENPDTWGIPLNENFSKIDDSFGNIANAILSGVGAVAEVNAVVLDNAPAINTAINLMLSRGGGYVMIPPGTYPIRTKIVMKDNVTLCGRGMGASTIFVDDSVVVGSDYITNSPDGGATWPALKNVTLRDFTIKGRADVVHTAGGQVIRIKGCENVRILDVESRYSRLFGMVVNDCNQVLVRGCKVFRCIADGIAIWNCPNTLIQGNTIIGANDDCISCHSDSTVTASPPAGGIVITGNMVENSQGIKVLGGKQVSISNNVLKRMFSYGIAVFGDYGAAPPQGATNVISISIAHNVITDVIFRPEPSPRNIICNYIMVGGSERQKGTAASVPGWPTGLASTITPVFENSESGFHPRFGGLYLNPINTTNNWPSLGGSWLSVHGNVMTRTLPAVASYSDWGYGPAWVGNNGDGTGFYDGPVTEASFKGGGIRLYPGLNNSVIENNIIEASTENGIVCNPFVTWENFDIWKMVIRNNRIADYEKYGIVYPLTEGSLYLDMTIDGNYFDADPRFVSTNRGLHGTWATFTAPNNLPAGIIIPDNAPSWTVTRNTFRNMCQPIAGSNSVPTPAYGNIIIGNFVGPNADLANAGVGFCYQANPAFKCVFEDSDPTSSNYGKRLSVSTQTSLAAPTTGYWARGDFVAYNGPPVIVADLVLLGWRRLTFGNANVSGVDWISISEVAPE